MHCVNDSLLLLTRLILLKGAVGQPSGCIECIEGHPYQVPRPTLHGISLAWRVEASRKEHCSCRQLLSSVDLWQTLYKNCAVHRACAGVSAPRGQSLASRHCLRSLLYCGDLLLTCTLTYKPAMTAWLARSLLLRKLQQLETEF
jgi:hypothetical protein